ncbi:MAG: M23 family metallopeptidase [Patescibacteria group bacterium]
MKISLFSKPHIIKVCFSLVIAIAIVGKPSQAYAGFFSDLVTKVLGQEIQAAEVPIINHNSQTVPLLESSSVDPDVKNSIDVKPSTVTIVEDEALASDAGLMGTDTIEKQYVTSAEIKTYTVKKGDTLEKIAKEFGVSKNTLIQSNDSVNSKGTIAVGQVLTILPIDGVAYTVKKGDTASSLAKTYNASVADILSYNALEKASDMQIGDTIVIPGGEKPVVAEKPAEKPKVKVPEDTIAITIPTPVTDTTVGVSTGETEPKSTSTPSSSGFIWPVTVGVGRISQRLHDDNAVDLAAPKGTPIYAPKDGTVLIADNSGYNGGYGLYVVVNFTDGGQMLFGHMSKVASTAGQKVSQGDVIGYVGTTGSSTGNHVHLSARGGIKNPYGFLRVNNTSADFK